MSERDEILEMAALHVEEIHLGDLSGILARRKRDREDADLRVKTMKEARQTLAREIRGLKGSRIGNALANLRIVAEGIEGRDHHDHYLVDAWPLAWKGWLDIFVTVKVNSNSVPPEAQYRIVLTDEGRAALASSADTGGGQHE